MLNSEEREIVELVRRLVASGDSVYTVRSAQLLAIIDRLTTTTPSAPRQPQHRRVTSWQGTHSTGRPIVRCECGATWPCTGASLAHQEASARAPLVSQQPTGSDEEKKDKAWLQVAERILTDFKNVTCLRVLLGEDNDGCGCMGCQSRAYFAARASHREAAARAQDAYAPREEASDISDADAIRAVEEFAKSEAHDISAHPVTGWAAIALVGDTMTLVAEANSVVALGRELLKRKT